MFDKIITYSIQNKLIVGILVGALVCWGVFSLNNLPIDAVPDITDNQVQVITTSPDLSAQEVEQLITFPLEMEMGNIPRVEEIRSISRFGLSIITLVFEDKVDIYWAREQINQKIQMVRSEIPEELGVPELGPITTGLGEIYQYTIYPDKGHEDQYDAFDLRTIQDWIIKRQLIGIDGVIEINSSGGYLKQYEIAIRQDKLKSFNIGLNEIFGAIEANNENSGGSYIEKNEYTYFIRGEGLVSSILDLEQTVITLRNGIPILLKDVAEIKIGKAPRFGAVTQNGKGEVVAGQVLMLKGANSLKVLKDVKARIEELKPALPEGIIIEPYLDRGKLIKSTTSTVSKNLIEGALIVIFILVIMLGNFKAGLIVASVIPLAMLFAVSCMRMFGVSANLMSLGAIDFGLIVDGAVIIVESILHHMTRINRQNGFSKAQKEAEVLFASKRIRKSAAFGEIIILIVYLPILFLRGVEGKMFIPMAQTVSFAILGALILSITYVPMMSALFLKNSVEKENSWAKKIVAFSYSLYKPLLEWALKMKYIVLGATVLLFVWSLITLSRMGAEFIPTLEEGDFALHQILPTGSSLEQGVQVSHRLQDILTSKFPEVEKVVTKIGTAEIPTDIMPIEAGDIFVIMKPKSEWTSASTKEEMFGLMEEELEKYPGVFYEFTQPIQMRFNELMTGIRQDIAIKIYGDDLGQLQELAHDAEDILKNTSGVGDVQVEATQGLQQMVVKYDRLQMAKYGISIAEISDVLKTAFAGKKAGSFYEGDKRFDIVVRLDQKERESIESLKQLTIMLPNGNYVPLSELAKIEFEEGPAQISRDDTKRRIVIGVNVRNRDIASLIAEIKQNFSDELSIPTGYYIRYGGQFENLERATATLKLVVPIALVLIFLLLFFTFDSAGLALLIFTAIPLSAIGGIWSLYLRGMPFSISAGVGFIALFGVAVLNGIVLIASFNYLRKEGMTDINEIIRKGTRIRLRPVLITAAVASLGFLPMALSNTAGGEVQRPLATVVIGGLITATFLTLIVLPILYKIFYGRNISKVKSIVPIIIIGLVATFPTFGQNTDYSVEQTMDLVLINSKFGEAYGMEAAAFRKQAEMPIAGQGVQLGFQSEEFNFDENMGIQAIGISKSFALPKVRQAHKAYYQGMATKILKDYAIEEISLFNIILEHYLEAAYYKSYVILLMEQRAHYQRYYDIYKRRNEVGEIGRIPVEQSQAEINVLTDLLGAAEDAYVTHRQALRRFTGKENFDVQAIDQIVFPTLIEDNVHPILQTFDMDRSIIDLKQNILNAEQIPKLNAGIDLQRVDGDLLYYGVQVGVEIPFPTSYKKKAQLASTLRKEANLSRENWEKQRLDAIQEKLTSSKELANQRISSLTTSLIPQQEQLIQSIKKAYDYGQTTYVEILMAEQKRLDLHEALLAQHKAYVSHSFKLIYNLY